MSKVNCAPGRGQGKVFWCVCVFFFQNTLSWLLHHGETFQCWLWNKWFKGNLRPCLLSFPKSATELWERILFTLYFGEQLICRKLICKKLKWPISLHCENSSPIRAEVTSFRVTFYVPAHLIQPVLVNDTEINNICPENERQEQSEGVDEARKGVDMLF